MYTGLVCSPQMHRHDQIPVLVCHVLETDIPQDTGVIYENIYAAKVLDGGIDNRLAILDTVVVCDGLPPFRLDLLDDGIGSL